MMSNSERFPSSTQSCLSGQIYCWEPIAILMCQSENIITLWKVPLAEMDWKALLSNFTRIFMTVTPKENQLQSVIGIKGQQIHISSILHSQNRLVISPSSLVKHAGVPNPSEVICHII